MDRLLVAQSLEIGRESIRLETLRIVGVEFGEGPHRQWKITAARGSNRRLDVFRRPATGDRARHAPGGLGRIALAAM